MTPEAQALVDLAERCEEVAAPDRKIDGAIDRLVRERPKDGDWHAPECAIWRVGEFSGLAVRSDGFARDSFSARDYTASLDAAMSLVPEGWAWTLDGGDPSCDDSASLGPAPAPGQMMNPSIITGASTPALALCAAALRALASLEKLERVDGVGR